MKLRKRMQIKTQTDKHEEPNDYERHRKVTQQNRNYSKTARETFKRPRIKNQNRMSMQSASTGFTTSFSNFNSMGIPLRVQTLRCFSQRSGYPIAPGPGGKTWETMGARENRVAISSARAKLTRISHDFPVCLHARSICFHMVGCLWKLLNFRSTGPGKKSNTEPNGNKMGELGTNL